MYTFYNEGKRGFTLIEVLASMAVLIVILLALVRLFDEASRAYDKGTTSVSRSAAARAAMEMITRDLEGAVIDRGCPFYKEEHTVDTGTASKPGAGFDEFFFVTMEGDQNDGRSYQMVHYYVDVYTATNAGVKYRGFRLKRDTMDSENVKKATGFDLLSSIKPPLAWWSTLATSVYWTRELVVDNIIRFERLYRWMKIGELIQMGSNGWIAMEQGYYSSDEVWNWGPFYRPANTPPAYVDIYLQITSDAAMKKGGATFLAGDESGDDTLRQEGRSLMYRESSVLVTRIHSAMWAAQIAHPISY